MYAGCALCGANVETETSLVALGPGKGAQVLPLCHPCSNMPDGPCVGCGQPAYTYCSWVDFLDTGACCDQPVCERCWQEVRFLNGTWALWCPQHPLPHATEERHA
jgi:hypothetical protein